MGKVTDKTNASNKQQVGVDRQLLAIALVSILLIAGLSVLSLNNQAPQEKPSAAETAPPPQGKIPVKVTSFSPTGEISRTQNITIEFDNNVVGDDVVGTIFHKAPVNIEPPIPVEFKWLERHKLGIFPVRNFDPATQYVVRVLPEIIMDDATYLAGKTDFSFISEPLKVRRSKTSYIFEEEETINTHVKWELRFNYKIDPKELSRNIRIFYDLEEGLRDISFSISPDDEPSREFVIRTEKIDRTREGASGKNIQFMVQDGLKCTAGPLPLAHSRQENMKVETDLKIYNLQSLQRNNQNYLQMEFSATVPVKNFEEHLSIEPEIEYYVEQNSNYMKIRAEFDPGQEYSVIVTKGLEAIDETSLKDDYKKPIRMPDLSPTVNFKYSGIFLPSSGNHKLAIETVNINRIRVNVDKLFLNNLVYVMKANPKYYDYYDDYYYDYHENNTDRFGRQVYSSSINVDSNRNQVGTSVLDMGDFMDTKRKGIYKVTASSDGELWRNDYTLVLMTDLGIVATESEDALFVWVNTLEGTKPVRGAEVKLISDNNQVIAAEKTGKDGVAVIKNLKDKIAEEGFTPYMITAEYEEDTTFLLIKDCRMPLTTFDIGGRKQLLSGYEAFVYSDRGIFRPGDEAHIAAVIRGKDVNIPKEFPVKLKILDPTNQTFKEFSKTPDNGMVEFKVDIPDYAKTGNYIAKLMVAGEEIGRDNFSVEDFIPDKIKVLIDTDKNFYTTGDKMDITVTGQSLFGPPASGRKVAASIVINAHSFRPRRWNDHHFGDPGKGFDEVEINLGESVLDDKGIAHFNLTIPEYIDPPAALKGVISATVTEHGGRAVSSYSTIDIHPYPFYIGLKPETEDYALIGEEYKIHAVVVDHDGEEIKPGPMNIRIYKYVYHSVLKKGSDGYYRYISDSDFKLINSYQTDDYETISYIPDSYGRFKIEVGDPDGKSVSAFSFYASGWGYAPWSMENPDRLEIEFEKASYKPNEHAKALVKAPFPGRLLVMVQREEVYDYWVETLEGNTATIEIPIKDSYRPNVYVSATLIKSLDEYDSKEPLRAFGIAPVMVDNNDRKLDIEITAPDSIRPQSQLSMDIRVKNPKGSTFITVAAVDEGILQLIDFHTPDPFGFFYGKKRLQTEYFDMYGYVLPEHRESPGKPGGDYLEKVRKKHLSPVGIRRVEPVSLWSGIVKTDKNGKAKITFDVPRFQGRLRVMVLGAGNSMTGSARKDIFVRDKIVLTPTFPRFISTGDIFTVPVTVYNGTGKDEEFTVKLDISGKVVSEEHPEKKIFIKSEEDGIVTFDLKAGAAIGGATFELTANGGGETTSSVTNVPVNPAAPVVTITGSGTITEDSPAEIDFPGGWIEGTENAKLTVSSFPAIEFTDSLQYLLRYPYGCIEQTTSKVFPLLYFDELAKVAAPEYFESNRAEYFVTQGINKLVSMQMNDGGFSYWPGGDYSSKWGSIYASNFLVEARKAGYDVPDYTYDSMLAYLKRIANEDTNDSYELQNRVYACYVLALAGQAPRGPIDYIRENQLSRIQPSSRFQLAMCFALAGDMNTAASLLPTEVHPADISRETGGNFNSSIRSNAIMLNVLIEVFPDSPGIPVLVKELVDSASTGSWYTTQDNAFAFMALGKTLKKESSKAADGSIYIDGNEYSSFNSGGIVAEDKNFLNSTAKVEIDNDGRMYYYWSAYGVPADGKYEEYEKGIRVERFYYDINGREITGGVFKQGQLVVIKVRVSSLSRKLDNVVIDDRLPAGLEIENTRLETRAEIEWIKGKGNRPSYMDIRDDRMLLFTDINAGGSFIFYYGARAITRGEFTQPPISAECMYDPSFSGTAGSGKIRVVSDGEDTGNHPSGRVNDSKRTEGE